MDKPIDAVITANGQTGIIQVSANTHLVIGWTSSNADICSVTPGGFFGISGSFETLVTSSGVTTYELICSNQLTTISRSVSVTVYNLPTATLTANDKTGTVFLSGSNSVHLSWTSAYSDDCQLSPLGVNGTSGHEEIFLQHFTKYVLRCWNAHSEVFAEVCVVMPLPNVNFLKVLRMSKEQQGKTKKALTSLMKGNLKVLIDWIC